MNNNPRLTIELVPATCWFSNVRNHVDSQTWDRLRRQTYQDVGRKCAICGGHGPKWPVECHERWEYDDAAHVQKLLGLTGLCPACHEVKHMGFANTQGRGAIAKAHLACVNGWTAMQSTEYVANAFQIWEARSQHEWKLDLTWLEQLGIHVETNRRAATPTEQFGSAAVAAKLQAKTKSTENSEAEDRCSPSRVPKTTPSAPISPSACSVNEPKPSEETEDFWVRAIKQGSNYPPHTQRGGKWLVFVPIPEVDGVWEQIKTALEADKLGKEAKVSTARPNPNAADNAEKVICVYTYDGDDEADVWRVRDGLRRLGVTHPLSWKPDQATRDGHYQVRGYMRLSRYRG